MHGALWSPGAAGGVDEQRQRIVAGRWCVERCRRKCGAAGDDGIEGLKGDAGAGELCACCLECLPLIIDLGGVVEHDDLLDGRRGPHRFHCSADQFDAYRKSVGFRFGQNGRPLRSRGAGL
ncbi:Uncharacterised protein [Mycobacteroides abscessus subsp. abscessus]|nr:Uncharacterised protein [Mycobacteroides abscessus subsp. abscessus]